MLCRSFFQGPVELAGGQSRSKSQKSQESWPHCCCHFFTLHNQRWCLLQVHLSSERRRSNLSFEEQADKLDQFSFLARPTAAPFLSVMACGSRDCPQTKWPFLDHVQPAHPLKLNQLSSVAAAGLFAGVISRKGWGGLFSHLYFH